MVPFTRRELTKAWKCSRLASAVHTRTDAHRLLLFYAVECGLKSVHLRRLNLDTVDECIAREHLHDLNSLLSTVKAGKEYFLPSTLVLKPYRARDGSEKPRNLPIGSLNQVWRYGGALSDQENKNLQDLLEKIDVWIAKEIQ